MSVKYGKTEKPQKILVDKSATTPFFARFIAEPFERTFGHSIGNAIRRILLSSLESPGIISVRIEGVPHEFMAIEGIQEDMTNIILNLKGALLRCLPSAEEGNSRSTKIVSRLLEITQEDLDNNGGYVVVTLADVFDAGRFEIVNPDHLIFTVTKPIKKQIDFRVGFGKGYVPSERHEIITKMKDEIIMDTSFSPVVAANYFVEHTRVGQDTDYDRLVLEVETDGRLTPIEALNFAVQIALENFIVFEEIKEHDIVFESDTEEEKSDEDELLDKLLLRINEVELSVRSTNCLTNADIDTIAELVCIPEKKMLDFRNFGKKSLNEIKATLRKMGLDLGMDLASYGIIEGRNVKERVKELTEERKKALKAI